MKQLNRKETLINSLCGILHRAHGAEEPKHIQKYVEVTSTAQRSDSPAQGINLCFLNDISQAGIYPLQTPEDVARLIQTCETSRLRYLAADLTGIRNKVQLLNRLAEALEFPEYFGNNWDALCDVLCDGAWFGDSGIVVHLKNTPLFEELSSSDWLTLNEILKEAIDYWRALKLPFWVFVG